MNTPAATILIVDDEVQNRRLLEALLRPEGYLTRCAASGAEALASIAQAAPDLVLLDIMMPGMDGYAVARTLKANPATAQIPIVMVTAQIDRSARLAGLEAGAEEFLTKPVDRAELWLRVRNLLRLKSFSDFLRDHAWLLEQQVQARTIDLQRFRTAMDATADAIFLVSHNGLRFIEVNATACSMLGYSREELLQLGPAQLGGSTVEEMEASYDALISGQLAKDMAETLLRRKDGSLLQVEVNQQAQRAGGDWIIVAVVRDITERKEGQKRLHHLAHYDALTGLPNRLLFHQTLAKTLELAALGGLQVAVMFIDLDHFKNVNDRLGHGLGDELLTRVSDRLMHCLRVRDTVGRLGGDEFAVILLIREGSLGASVVAKKIREALRAPFDLRGQELTVTASIGIAIAPDDASDTESLLRFADTAMYRAKQAGRDTFRFFTALMNTEVSARIDMEADLRKALQNDEFVVHYQPKADLASGRVTGVEALLRWQRPGQGLVAPNEFIPVLEETGLIGPVGAWVIATACRQAGAWLRSEIGPIKVAVNVSSRQFSDGQLEADVLRSLGDSGISADLLELELTESTLMANTERTVATLNNLKRLGVRISIDDFGTGYSCLAYLRRFPIDNLKIDISFIRDITSNRDDATIALAIIRMAHSLGLEVVAEGVETAAQLAYLKRHGCDQIQGFFLSRSLPPAELEQLLRQNVGLPVGARQRPRKRAASAAEGQPATSARGGD